jgi:hypothetical protein
MIKRGNKSKFHGQFLCTDRERWSVAEILSQGEEFSVSGFSKNGRSSPSFVIKNLNGID